MDEQAAREAEKAPEPSNAPTWSVSELAFALRRTLEDAYGFVRLRGELSKVTFHGNGHVYLDIKDDKACIAGVIWKTQVRGLAIRPQTGMEVVITGRVTTYPGRSQYQIIIESLTPAGVGALLAQLERLKARLAGEGLFAAERKRPLPAMPAVIGVITSPTGAVIRDILHRLRERWPCRVIVWPVVVQGEAAAGQVRAAIEGFANLAGAGPGGLDLTPDLIIVARGGGSVEDLWPFNDETLARAAAASPIPLISAIGHETDTTLIDFVADRRAPTPTAAAEIATPVLADLAAGLADYERRLLQCGARAIEQRRSRLGAAAGALPRGRDVVFMAGQRLDFAGAGLAASLQRNIEAHRRDLIAAAAPLRPESLRRAVTVKKERLADLVDRLRPCVLRRLERAGETLAHADKLRLSFNPDGPLARGFARVHHADGRLAKAAAALRFGESVRLVFADAARRARVEPGEGGVRPPARLAAPGQGDLF